MLHIGKFEALNLRVTGEGGQALTWATFLNLSVIGSLSMVSLSFYVILYKTLAFFHLAHNIGPPSISVKTECRALKVAVE